MTARWVGWLVAAVLPGPCTAFDRDTVPPAAITPAPTADPVLPLGPAHLIANTGAPSALAVDDTTIYWVEADKHLRSLPKAGTGMPRTLIDTALDDPSATIGDLATTTTAVFVLVSGSGCGRVLGWVKASEKVESLDRCDAGPLRRIAGLGGRVYWSAEDNVEALVVGGGPPSRLRNDPGAGFGSIAINSMSLFVADRAGIERLNIASGGENHVADGAAIEHVVSDDVAIYWGVRGGLFRQLLSSGGPIRLADSASPRRLALAGNYLYWTDDVAGTVSRVKTDGGPAEVLAHDQSGAFGIATDNAAVYWSTRKGGTIARLPLE